MTNKWSYLTRTTPDIGLLQLLEVIVRTKLSPALTGRPPPNDTKRDLLALPARLGGIALVNPTRATDTEFLASSRISKPLKEAILQQSLQYTAEVVEDQIQAKNDIHNLKRQQATDAYEILMPALPHSLKRCMALAQEKGVSSWLTSMPIEEFGFALHKSAFHDALTLRYNWQPVRAPYFCGCGVRFSLEHALSCPKCGFPSVRHNEIRNLTANLLSEVCNDV